MNRPPPIPNDAGVAQPGYAAPWLAPAPHRPDWYAFASHLTGWALGTTLLMLPCLFILPRYEHTLADFNAKVPAATQFALGAARFLRSYGVLLAPVALAHALFVAFWYPRAGVTARRVYRLALTLFVCALFGTVIFALFLPMISLTESLTGVQSGD